MLRAFVLGSCALVLFSTAGCVEKGDTNVSPSSGGSSGTGGSGGSASTCPESTSFGGKLCFSEPITATQDPTEIVAADFDGDGKPDVASAFTEQRTVEVSLNDGSGGFEPAVAYGTVTMPLALASGDIDSDGDQDLVVGSDTLSQVVVLLNDGTGAFAPTLPYSVESPVSPVTALAVADLDGDSRADLVIAAPYFGVVIFYGEKG